MSDTWDYLDLHGQDDRSRVHIIDTSNLTIAQYQEAATRTLLDAPEVPVEGRDIMLIWNALGLAGEAGELAELVFDYPHEKGKIADELGDAVWYIAANATKLNMSFTRIVGQADRELYLYTTPQIIVARLCVHAGKVADLFKKGILHRHGLDTRAIEDEYVNCMTCICGLATEYELPFRGVVLAGNLKKIDRRYKKTFTSRESRERVEYKSTTTTIGGGL